MNTVKTAGASRELILVRTCSAIPGSIVKAAGASKTLLILVKEFPAIPANIAKQAAVFRMAAVKNLRANRKSKIKRALRAMREKPLRRRHTARLQAAP